MILKKLKSRKKRTGGGQARLVTQEGKEKVGERMRGVEEPARGSESDVGLRALLR